MKLVTCLILSWFVAGTYFPSVSYGQPIVLANGAFDTDIISWTFDGDPEIELTWDAGLGDPSPGSLRLSKSGAVSGAGAAEALSECFDPPPGAAIQVRSRTLAQGSVRCRAYISRYEGTGCTGDRLRLGGAGSAPFDPQDVWIGREMGDSDSSRPSFRVALLGVLGTSDDVGSCNFDSVVISSGSPLEIPAMTDFGLAVLAVSLGAVGLWLMRRN